MHYANGRAAKIGDLVRGKGYNFRHEIIGILIKANPSSSSCNCEVACVGVGPKGDRTYGSRVFVRPKDDGMGWELPWPNSEIGPEVCATVEYGQLDAFLALDPATGEVLPPEQGS